MPRRHRARPKMETYSYCLPCKKTLYPNKRMAENAVKTAYNPQRKGVYFYPCPEGFGYHLTTKAKWK